MQITGMMDGRSGRVRRGVAATDFAAVLPLVMLVTLGCIDLGRFAYSYIAVTNAARAGAGFAMMNSYDANTQAAYLTKVQQAAADEMTGQTGFIPANLTVTPTIIDEGSGDKRIRVVASYPFQTIITWPGIPHNLTLQRTVAMRKIR